MTLLKQSRYYFYSLFFLLVSLRCGGENTPHNSDDPMKHSRNEGPPSSATTIGPATSDDAAMIKLLRDSCQRCHDNARVKRVEQGETIGPIIRSANFNMQSLKDQDFKKSQTRQKILRAIQKNMPVSVFVVNKKEFTKEKFLESTLGQGLLNWLKTEPEAK